MFILKESSSQKWLASYIVLVVVFCAILFIPSLRSPILGDSFEWCSLVAIGAITLACFDRHFYRQFVYTELIWSVQIMRRSPKPWLNCLLWEYLTWGMLLTIGSLVDGNACYNLWNHGMWLILPEMALAVILAALRAPSIHLNGYGRVC